MPIEHFHHDVVDAVGALDLVDGTDVWMTECSGGARFFGEPAGRHHGRSPVGQHFDCNRSRESRVPRAIDVSKAARTENALDIVRPEALARSERHDQRLYAA